MFKSKTDIFAKDKTYIFYSKITKTPLMGILMESLDRVGNVFYIQVEEKRVTNTHSVNDVVRLLIPTKNKRF